MPISINTNYAASAASKNLALSNSMLQRSLNRLSSGSRIVNPNDDAGGLAVSMRLSATAKRSGSAATNLNNAVSLLQNQDGVLKARDTYEIMRAEDVGWSANKIVLGKLSGRNAFKQRLQELGVSMDSEVDLNAAFTRFKTLADQKSEIFDEDIMSILSNSQQQQGADFYRFVSLSQHSETGEVPRAKIVLQMGGIEQSSSSEGNGPVDATLNAIEVQAQSGAELLLYSVNAITAGTQSQGEVTVRLTRAGRVVNGVGTDPDIVAASAKAYLAALNRLHDPAGEKINAQMAP